MIYLELFRQERFSANGFFVGNCISVDRQSPVSERQQFNDCWHVLGGTLRYRALPFQEVAMRTCELCGNQIVGKSNRRFCSKTCSSKYARSKVKSKTDWEVDWSYSGNTGSEVLARNLNSHMPLAREWHMVNMGYLRTYGINSPTYSADSWEVDWSVRDGKKVWARNPYSKMPAAREWHWIDQRTLARAGVKWKHANAPKGRYISGYGYVQLTRRGMTDDDIKLAESHGLFRGKRKLFVNEHQLVAVKKYGKLPPHSVVRHLNGIKTDNRPENLVLGTTQENTMDHVTARMQAMYWREKYESLKKEFDEYRTEQR